MRKLCQTCQIEKDLNDFYKYTKRDGTKAYRNMCKTCKNKQDKKGKVILPVNNSMSVKKEIKPDKIEFENISEKDFKEMDDLLKRMESIDFDTLFSLIDNSDKILKMVDINISYKADTGIKIKKSITISENIHNKILQLSRSSNLNYSNVVDMLLKKALENE
jgi:hypothetical protein